MVEVEMKYGFPLFARPSSIVNLGKNEKLIISDIWAFWDYVIKKSSSDKKKENFLRSLLEQAKHFYIAAEESPVKSQPLLYYYSFLNLSKIMINMHHSFGARRIYMHGMKEVNNNKFLHSEIVKQKQKTTLVQVAHELVSIFDPSISTNDMNINVKEMLNHCVGVHRAYCEIYGQTEIFCRLTKVNLHKQGKTLIFNAQIQCDDAAEIELKLRGYNIDQNEDGKYVYSESVQMANYRPTRQDYANLSQKIRDNGIWYFIGNDGYTMYLSTCQTLRLRQESIIYMMMFYLGSITRYHPYMFDEIFSDKEQWLMSEFLNTQPKQFLYLGTANILGQSVLKAYASF